MSADADHEVIDSPAALFRHLYEEHGVEEARDLDPESAPLQFWLRRHADLERAQRAARRRPNPPPDPGPEPRPSAQRGRPEGRGRAEPGRAPAPPFPPAGGRGPGRPDGAGAGRDGRRQAGFGDPLVEAVARALAGRGYDEAVVRSAIRSFAAGGGGPSGEAAVRAVFVEPMLQSAAEHLLDAPGTGRPVAGSGPFPPPDRRQPTPAPQRPQPTPTAPARPAATRPEPDPAPASPPRREEPARPEAAWAVLWADLADSGRRPDEGAGSGGDDGDDLMAVANAVQARRRVRLLRR
jgi:hypothetical protein